MSKELETMSLSEYRTNAFSVLQDYHGFIPERVWQSAYWVLLQYETTESDITRALHTCRDAL